MINTIIELNPVKLAVSVRYQARKTPGQQPLPELADSIAAQGLLQNLVVAKAIYLIRHGRCKGFYSGGWRGRRNGRCGFDSVVELYEDGTLDCPVAPVGTRQDQPR